MNNEMYLEGLNSGVPCISVNHNTSLMTSVVANNVDGAYSITKMLTDYGHKKIAVITGIRNYQTSIERMSGVQKLYLKEGLKTDEILVIDGDWLFTSGVSAGRYILEMPKSDRPTSVFAFNDDMAFGCYSALTQGGVKVPEEISIAGFDKSDRYDSIFPSLTTVDVNIDAMIEYACWVISGCLDGSSPDYCATIQIDTSIYDNGTIIKII
jgi:DNA-binding LacI/PurR family transcriptional regulator